MQKEDLDFFRKWFSDYVSQFSSSDSFVQDNIKLKIEHTERVCENILKLSKSEKIDDGKCNLAETIALFHDLGRFEQFTKYKTFKDSESENHALLGVKILERTGILSRLPVNEKDLILKAVEYHNLMEIPSSAQNSKELLFYSKLIRDADKLDILKIICEDYRKKDKNPALDFNLPESPWCSKSIVTDILNNRMAKIGEVRNQNDVKFLRVSWVFDINFPAAFLILKEEKYMNIILSLISAPQEKHIIEKHIEKYLDEAETNARNRLNIF